MKQKDHAETTYYTDCPLRIALLADFHNSDPEPVLRSLQKHRPDIITIAGDLIFGDRPKGTGSKIDENRRAIKLLQGCTGIAPVFFSLGNHEYLLTDSDLESILSTGVTLLDNSWAEYNGCFIGGLSSAYCRVYREFRARQSGEEPYPKPARYVLSDRHVPDLSWLDAFGQLGGFRVLLCHHPEYYPLYLRGRGIDLICAGHCHGGQWRYYSWIRRETRGVFAPGQGLFPSLTSGIHDNRLVISRGLSNPTFVPRINNPTEVVYLVPQTSA